MKNGAQEALYDVAVIGGGIAGTAVARDAALRGLRVVLFEKRTFGSGASAKSSRLIHGGIRYLELSWNAFKAGRAGEAWKNFRFVFASLAEARILERIAPSLVRPIALVIPVYAGDKRRPGTVYFGAWLYWLLAIISGGARKPEILASKRAVLEAVPGLREEGLLGGVRLWDRHADDAGLVRATAASARAHGALCLENAPVTGYAKNAAGLFDIHADTPEGPRTFVSKSLVDASGPWIDRTRALGGEKSLDYVLPVAGAHITLTPFLPASVILQADDGRIFFVINTGGAARVGTTERECREPENIAPTEDEIDYLLKGLKRYFPGKDFLRKDILSQDAGIRPLALEPDSRDPHAVSREHALRQGPTGAFHLVGVKLTDHRRAAEETVDRLGLTRVRSRTSRERLL